MTDGRTPPRIVFMGTPSTAVPSLAAAAAVGDPVAVLTRPDRPRGRSGKPVPPPVKTAADEWGFPVSQPADTDELRRVTATLDADLGIVVAYGMILPPDVLAAFPLGCLNVHFSLLPRWRGAAPVERAILAGDTETGVTVMRMDEGLDTGPVLGERRTAIEPGETAGHLTARLSHMGAVLIADLLPAYLSGAVRPVPQLDAGATYARRLRPDEARIAATDDAETVVRKVLAFNPRPGAWLVTPEGRLKVLRAAVADHDAVPPGLITPIGPEIVMGTPRGTVRLDVVQPEGKRPMDAAAWMRGRRNRPTRVEE